MTLRNKFVFEKLLYKPDCTKKILKMQTNVPDFYK